MKSRFVTIDIPKLKRQLNRLRLACLAAIEIGDCHAVARLTCEAARLRSQLGLVSAMTL
jgi:hypothetical protein